MMRLVSVLALSSVATSTAWADGPDDVPGISDQGPTFTQGGPIAPISVVEGAGWKVGEGTVLRPVVGIETGVISNVFFENGNEGPKAAGVMRLIAQIGAGSLSSQRLAQTGGDSLPEGQTNIGLFEYRADLRVSYDIFLSGEDVVQSQNGLGIGATFRGALFPRRTWSFLYLENYQRLIRSTNFESSQQTNRDINRLQLGLQFAPGGRSLSGLLHYENVIDFFEADTQRFSNRMQHSIGLTASWRFRPMTVFFADVTQGVFAGLGSESTKVDSYPLTATVGAQTLLTLNTSLVGYAGYTNGFYSSGPNYAAVVGGLQLGYRYTPTGRITAIYDYTHQDSINANFFRDHRVGLNLEQQIVPFMLNVQPEIRFRRYEGVSQVVTGAPDTRDDLVLAVSAGARYNFRDWFAGVAEYRLSSVQTDFRYMVAPGVNDDPSYVLHELVVGIRAAL